MHDHHHLVIVAKVGALLLAGALLAQADRHQGKQEFRPILTTYPRPVAVVPMPVGVQK